MAGDVPPRWQIQHSAGPTWTSATECQFRVWAPHGEAVVVELQGESGANMEIALSREGDFWTGSGKCAPGMKYRIAMGSSWNDCFPQEGARLFRRDPCARECDFESNWCILHAPIVAPKPFVAPKFNELIIYELHIGSFVAADSEHKAFAETSAKLAHIATLGFNCVQLMPTAEFGGIWGYNSRQLLAAHGPWGTAEELKEMVEKAHSLGIAVLFDLVLNHGSAKKNVLWNWDGYGPDKNGGIYFEGQADTPWGKRFAWQKPEVQDYLKQACRTCIEEYGADGLRFDSVHNMPWWLLQQLTHGIKEHYPEKILIAEITPENPKVISDGGFHSCWLHASHFDSVKLMTKSDGGGEPSKRTAMLKNMLSPHGFPNIGGVHSILGSHDQIGDRSDGKQDNGKHRYYVSRLGGRGNWHARAQCRAWFAFQNCCKGLPMTFMGTETLQEGWWHVDQHHRFNWQLTSGADAHAAEMMRLVAASNRVRLSSPGMLNEELRVVHEDCESCILACVRWAGDQASLCIAHFGEAQWDRADYGLATGWGGGRRWRLTLNSQGAEFGGWPGSASEEVEANDDGRILINIPKWSLLVYTS